MSSKNWREVQLGTICDVKGRIGWRGYTVQDLRDEGPLVIGATQISADQKLDLSKPVFLSREKYLESPEIIIEKDDIIVVKVGNTIGKVAIVSRDIGEACINPNTVLLKRISCNPYFLYYFLISADGQSYLKNNSSASAQPALNQTMLKQMPVRLPKRPIQDAIAEILATLDEKIELNRQTNATLEAIAQAIFKEWFVHYNYPGATGNLVDSELGMIPVGWQIRPLDDIADFLNGLALQKYPAEEGEEYLPVIKIRELRNGITDSSDKANLTVPEKYIIENGDLLFSWSGSLLVKFWTGGKGALNQHLFKVTSNEFPLWFCYCWVLYHLNEFQRIAADKATTMGHIKRSHLTQALCLVPDNLESMDAKVSAIIDKVIENEIESEVLAKIRDTLLPKLMRGEIEV
jgi:type I restriction enzyme, S subunit